MIDYAGYIKLDLGICTIIKGPKFSESQCFKYSPNRNCHVVVKKMCYNASFVVIPNNGNTEVVMDGGRKGEVQWKTPI